MSDRFDIESLEKMNRSQLADAMNYLIEQDFHALVQLLYRIDINENVLKQTLHDNADTNAGELIADLIIQRQQQKALLREQFRKNRNDIPDEDKW
ncbi:MAG: hypothetical protein KGO81_09405 [Bacteroidota bacterium]|nr:hypothetical protein [Bacteroidota bacterium]